MKVLITGANGFLGQHLCRSLISVCDVFATGKGVSRIPFKEVAYCSSEITDADNLLSLCKTILPDCIIHTAAMSRPDECNNNRQQCDNVNIGGMEALISAARSLKNDPHIIYISSDFVLGENGPHNEETSPAPLNYYGYTKLQAEKLVAESGLNYTIVRPVFMYGEIWQGLRPTFLHWVKQSLEEGRGIQVVCDQIRTPSYIGDICKGITAIMQQKATGLFHLAGEERISPYDMAVKLAGRLGLDHTLIEPVTAATFHEPVARARQGGLLIEKAKEILQFRPISFDEGLRLSFPGR